MPGLPQVWIFRPGIAYAEDANTNMEGQGPH